jgi:hypothetical protein
MQRIMQIRLRVDGTRHVCRGTLPALSNHHAFTNVPIPKRLHGTSLQQGACVGVADPRNGRKDRVEFQFAKLSAMRTISKNVHIRSGSKCELSKWSSCNHEWANFKENRIKNGSRS